MDRLVSPKSAAFREFLLKIRAEKRQEPLSDDSGHELTLWSGLLSLEKLKLVADHTLKKKKKMKFFNFTDEVNAPMRLMLALRFSLLSKSIPTLSSHLGWFIDSPTHSTLIMAPKSTHKKKRVPPSGPRKRKATATADASHDSDADADADADAMEEVEGKGEEGKEADEGTSFNNNDK